MRRLLRKILLRPVLWASARFSSRPRADSIFKSMDSLYQGILKEPGKKGPLIPFEGATDKFILFSDQHKGGKDGSDDFILAEPNYLAALDYYYKEGFHFINLGDSEELWENSLGRVKKCYAATFESEKRFADQGRYVKIYGNHDLYWDNDPIAWWQLKNIFKSEVKIYEAVVLVTKIGEVPLHIFCTHGHQGDSRSDGNWFSKFFVSRIWAPLQSYLRINPNTPAFNTEKKTLHNDIMYEWSSRQTDLLLITGHTHQPVFASLTQLEKLYREFQYANSQKNAALVAEIHAKILAIERNFTAVAMDYLIMKPYYFNTGCCCFNDGDITGIEISGGNISLVKWARQEQQPTRMVLQAMALSELARKL